MHDRYPTLVKDVITQRTGNDLLREEPHLVSLRFDERSYVAPYKVQDCIEEPLRLRKCVDLPPLRQGPTSHGGRLWRRDVDASHMGARLTQRSVGRLGSLGRLRASDGTD
jgi:hypothetical protein